MTENRYAVIILHSTSHAIRVEKLLQAQEIVCKMIPVPRQISSDCGVCVRVWQNDVDLARQAVEKAGVEIEGIYDL